MIILLYSRFDSCKSYVENSVSFKKKNKKKIMKSNLKLIGYDVLPSFCEEFSVNRFYDVVTFGLKDVKYILYVESINHDGIPCKEWYIFDLTLENVFTTSTKLYSYITNIINERNKINTDLANSIICEDDKNSFNVMIKDISITYYRYI